MFTPNLTPEMQTWFVMFAAFFILTLLSFMIGYLFGRRHGRADGAAEMSNHLMRDFTAFRRGSE